MLNRSVAQPENNSTHSRCKLTPAHHREDVHVSAIDVRSSHHRKLKLLSWLFVAAAAGQTLFAEDNLQKSNRMLEDLKQRSAAERWQRVKRMYPAETPAVPPGIPSPLLSETPRTVTHDDVPQLTTDGSVIPRLSALPISDSSDWVKPARPPELAEEVIALPELSDTALPDEDSRMVPNPGADTPLPVRIAVADVDEDQEEVKRDDAVRAEAKNGTKPAKDDKDGVDSPRSPIERMIGSITPHYDRDEDSDIRKYARQQAKEFNIHFANRPYEERAFPQITLAWEAANYWHYPLYFEDPALERTGHSHHPIVQPFASIGRAAVQLGLLPYQMVIIPPCKHEYPLGWYRPGECAPKLHYQIPLNAEAALVEAGVVTGLYFVIP